MENPAKLLIMTSPSWDRLHAPLPLADDQIHVIHVDLTCTDPPLEHWLSLLTPDEIARANRYRFPQPRASFIACRGRLRHLLGSCLDCDPRTLRFDYGDHGKPGLAMPAGSEIQFNVSHSGDHALLAVTRQRRIGIDLEQLNPAVQFVKLARRFFSPRESDQLLQLPETERMAGFYRGWTSKEAFLKATGMGLAFPLRQFTVSLDPHAPPQLIHVENHPEDTDRWRLVAVDRPGYAGTLLFEASPAERVELNWWTATA